MTTTTNGPEQKPASKAVAAARRLKARRAQAKTDARDQAILAIAKQHLDLETLETRRMDGLDFSDQAVWSLKAALEAAYEAGRQAAK